MGHQHNHYKKYTLKEYQGMLSVDILTFNAAIGKSEPGDGKEDLLVNMWEDLIFARKWFTEENMLVQYPLVGL